MLSLTIYSNSSYLEPQYSTEIKLKNVYNPHNITTLKI